jgi:hypothetical protein
MKRAIKTSSSAASKDYVRNSKTSKLVSAGEEREGLARSCG